MPHDIFGDVARPPTGLGSQSWYTVPLSIVVHALLVAIVVIVPLMATDVIPAPTSILTAVVAPPLPDPPPMPVERRVAPERVTSTEQRMPSVPPGPVAPVNPGDTLAKEAAGPPLPPGRPEIGVPPDFGETSSGRSPIVGIPTPPAPVPSGPVRPGGVVKYPEKVRDVRPIYPKLAADSKVEGRVIIEAIIGIDGRVNDAKVLRSIPLLDRAALEAVQQWRFTPTLLNGVPVPVIITITVDFKLH